MLLLFFVAAILLQYFRLQLFFPLLATAALRLSRLRALWVAAGCGFYLDLLASDHYLGFRTMILVLVMACLYSYRRLVLEEKCLAFCLYSTLFGSLFTTSIALLQTIGSPHFHWSFSFVGIDLALLPLIDSLLGWVLFIAPKPLIRFLKRSVVHWKSNE